MDTGVGFDEVSSVPVAAATRLLESTATCGFILRACITSRGLIPNDPIWLRGLVSAARVRVEPRRRVDHSVGIDRRRLIERGKGPPG